MNRLRLRAGRGVPAAPAAVLVLAVAVAVALGAGFFAVQPSAALPTVLEAQGDPEETPLTARLSTLHKEMAEAERRQRRAPATALGNANRVRRNDIDPLTATSCSMRDAYEAQDATLCVPAPNATTLVLLVDSIADTTDTATNEFFANVAADLSTKVGNISHLVVTAGTNNWALIAEIVMKQAQWPAVETVTMNGNFRGTLFDGLFASFPAVTTIDIKVPSAVLTTNTFTGGSLANTLTALLLDDASIRELPENAFSGLTSLQELHLQKNRLRELPDNAFHNLPSLTQLYLHENQLSSLPSAAFQGLTNLEQLVLNNNRLRALPSTTIFQPLTSLTGLFLQNNHLKALPAGVFDHLTSLTDLFLNGNDIAELSHGVFASLTELIVLEINDNAITTVNENTFDALQSLTRLELSNNRITSLQSNVFAGIPQATALFLDGNGLASLPNGVFNNVPNLQQLWLQDNALTALSGAEGFSQLNQLVSLLLQRNKLRTVAQNAFGGLGSLQFLYLHGNALTSLPSSALHPLTSLQLLRLSNNSITALAADQFSENAALEDLWLDGLELSSVPQNVFNPLIVLRYLHLDGNARLVFHTSYLPGQPQTQGTLERLFLDNTREVVIESNTPTFELSHLGLVGATVVGDLRDLLLVSSPLTHFTIGWNGLNEQHIPVEELCSFFPLRQEVSLFSVQNSAYQSFEVCFHASIGSMVLRNNKQLHTVTARRHDVLDVSDNPVLSIMTVQSAPILIISGTMLPFSDRYCIELGQAALVARNMQSATFNEDAETLLIACIEKGEVLDFSGNEWLANIERVRNSLPDHVVLGEAADVETASATNVPPLARTTVPLIILGEGPIRCDSSVDVVQFPGGIPAPAFTYQCECRSTYRQIGDMCVEDNASTGHTTTGIAVAIAVGVIAIGMGLYVYIHRVRSERQEIQNNPALHQQLIGSGNDGEL